MKKSVMCIVETQSKAEVIVSQVEQAGFARSDISVLLPSESAPKDFAHEHNTKARTRGSRRRCERGWCGRRGDWVARRHRGTRDSWVRPAHRGRPAVGRAQRCQQLERPWAASRARWLGWVSQMEAKRYEGRIKGGNILISVHTSTNEEQTRVEQIFKTAPGAGHLLRHGVEPPKAQRSKRKDCQTHPVVDAAREGRRLVNTST